MNRALFFLLAGLCFFAWAAFGEMDPEDKPNLTPPTSGSSPAAKTTPRRVSVKPVEKPSPTPTPIVIGKNLVANGNFEKKNPHHDSPLNWQLCDGLTTYYEKEAKYGWHIRIDTDVPKEEARERWKVMEEKGVNAPPAPKKSKSDNGYSAIGGVDGVHFFSDPIPVNKGSRYKLAIDARGVTSGNFFTKIFVKGYGVVTKTRKIRKEDGSIEEKTETEERQVFKWYLACRNEGKDEWNHFEEWIPCDMPRNVDFVKICIYAYWPLGNYYFDNVEFYEGKLPPETDDKKN
ncbi:MAG: hypothetical protein Kow00107_09310 [Planctomycetota bacterium]